MFVCVFVFVWQDHAHGGGGWLFEWSFILGLHLLSLSACGAWGYAAQPLLAHRSSGSSSNQQPSAVAAAVAVAVVVAVVVVVVVVEKVETHFLLYASDL